MRVLKPHPYQGLMLDFALPRPRCAWWAGMGMGKTSTSLLLVLARMLAGLVQKTLVLAPLRVARDTWPDEAAKWEDFQGLRVEFLADWTHEEKVFLRARAHHLKLLRVDPKSKLLATKEAEHERNRLRAVASASRIRALAPVDVFTVNYDVLEQFVEIMADVWPFQMVIADELTRLKSYRAKQGGKRASAFAEVAHTHVEYFLGLTGTPAPNGLLDLFGQTYFIDAGKRLGCTYSAFTDRWFRAKPNGGDARWSKLEPMPHSQAEIERLLKGICLTVDPADWFDLEAPQIQVKKVKLPPKAMQHYRELEKKMFTEIEGEPIEAFSAAGKTMKCLQATAGALYTEDGGWVALHDEKIEMLKSIVEEANGMPVLVGYHFESDRERLKQAFPDALDLAVEKDLKAAKRGEGRVWLAHPQSVGHGVDGLQYHSCIAVFFTTWWDLETHLQIIERVGPVRQHQAGLKRVTWVYYIVAQGTIDETVLERQQSKKSVQQLLMDAMNERKQHALT